MSYGWIRLDKTEVVTRVPCQIFSVTVSPSGDSKRGNVMLYDGESALDPPIVRVYSGLGTTQSLSLPVPLVCRRGLYVEFGGSLEECMIQMEPVKY